jgi:hypothetical protein
VGPLSVKSLLPTLLTASVNVTRHVTLPALVGLLPGVCRTTDATVGAVLSSS